MALGFRAGLVKRGIAPEASPVLLPGEHVLLVSVTLPALSPAHLRAAAAFAVEDRIAQPLDEVRVVLGPQLPPGSGRWLVAVVAEPALRAVAADRVVYSDVMMVPVPDSGWAVAGDARRLRLRLPDGSGAALPTPLALDLWRAAGQPAVTGYGADLPAEMAGTGPLVLPEGTGILPGAFDLGTATGRRNRALPRGSLRAAAMIALGLGGHLGLTALDSATLSRQIAHREADLVRKLQLTLAPGGDVLALAARHLGAGSAAPTAGFLGLLTTAWAVMPQAGPGVSLGALRYRGQDDRLTLGLVAGDIAALQAVEAALATAGLRVVAGPAATRSGVAEAEMALTRSPGAAP